METGAEINIRTNAKVNISDNSAERIDNRSLSADNDDDKGPSMVPFCSLFRFATQVDAILMVIGTICAMAMGTALPAFAILWGNMTDNFGDEEADIKSEALSIMLSFIYIGLGALAGGWGMFACWMIAGERQAIACRKAYLASLLRQ